MFLKYWWLILALHHFANCFNPFGMVNVFQYLNEELDSFMLMESKRNFEDIRTHWIDQELDHFDSKETRNWKMRYFERLDYWKYNGPLYLFIGGESEVSPNWTRMGLLHDIAKETDGAIYVSEHRYYGKSIPLNVSSTHDFKFLTSRQAIADIAKLLKSIKSLPQYNKSKVVVIGGSYAGNLATWLKSLYPELVDVVLASSAPLLAKTDFYEYLEKVGDNYERYGTDDCIERIRETFLGYEKLFKILEGTNNFGLTEYKYSFFGSQVFPFMDNSQYGTTEMINHHCELLPNAVKKRKTRKNYYNNFIRDDNRQNYTLFGNPWTYQSCTEFGYFFSTSSDLQPFTKNMPIEILIESCTISFGSEFDSQRVNKGVEETNKLYGGLRPNVTKVIFTNGEIDPWSTLSISEDSISNNNQLVILPKASHCRDLLAKINDDEEIKRAAGSRGYKYYPFILLLNQYVSGGADLFCIGNGFKYLNDEINLEPPLEELTTQIRWLKQQLDHFNTTDKRVWKMRYFQRLSYRKQNGPIYLFLGGESPATSRWAETGIMYELAKETNGSLYVSEHRYYGESRPLNGTDAEALKYLSARQALADNAYLLKYLKRLSIHKKSKVVVVGGSYSGNLAAWMKLLYPDLIDAAIASSAPVLAIADFYQYLEKVSDIYEQYGTKNCLDTVKNIFKRYDELMQSSKGIQELKKEQNLCDGCDLSSPENQYLFFSFKVGEFMSVSQYGTTEQIKSHCKSLQNESAPIIQSEENTRDNCTCYDFDGMIEGFYNEGNEWIISWMYQTCNELGYFATTSSDEQPFTDNMPLKFNIRMCRKLFGPDFDEERLKNGVAAVNELYGALNPNVTNVVFSNGDLDPWSTLSILEDLSYDAPAVVIPRASHCRDLFSNREGDIEELKEARKHIKNLVKKWIGAEC